MANTLDQMMLRGQAEAAGAQTALLSAPEAERMIEQLCNLSVEEVGTAKFLAQHDNIQKLNLQAHYNAQTHSDEFVMEQLASFDKIGTLVYNLLVIEAWQDRVYPLLKKHLANKVDQVLSYMLLYHETAIANLLEVTLFHQSACEAAGEDALLELVDWCHRKLQYLNSGAAHEHAQAKERTAKELMALDPVTELEEKRAQVAFSTSLCALTILRYLTDHVAALPLGLLGRLLVTNDTVMALLPLLERPPWVRTRKGQMERYVDNRWQKVAPADRLKLGQHDAQAWLALNNLLVEPKCRAKLDLDDYRKEALLKLQRRAMHEPLLEQLPVLADMQRCLSELALGVDTGSADQHKASRLILEQVPLLRERILKGKDWAAIAAAQKAGPLGPASKRLAKERLDAMMQAFEYMAAMEQDNERGADGAVSGSGRGSEEERLAAPVKVTCSRKVGQGVWEPWCDLCLTINPDVAPVEVEVAAEGGATVTGRRHRLHALGLDDSRPLPVNGKVVVSHAGSSAEAVLQLPAVPLRNSKEGPAGLWLTVGLLATDGFALQLRLKKADQPKERDRIEGVWYAYHVVGGAITLLDDSFRIPQ